MSCFQLVATLLGIALSGSLWADDLSKVERKIVKEPPYKSQPKYCLLVFGPKANYHVWLVLDGDVLYVDRNGNGDLTEQGERVDNKKRLGANAGFGLEWHGGDLTDATGKISHTDLILRRMGFGSSLSYTVTVTVEGKRQQYAGIDDNGMLQFGDQPQSAPLIHFGGFLAMKPLPIMPQTLRHGEKTSDLTAVIGTPGVGKGTLAMLFYTDYVPDELHPVAEITFPSRDPGTPAVILKVPLSSRC